MKPAVVVLCPVLLALAGLVLFWSLLASQAHQFETKADDLAEGIRVSLIDLEGNVVYDTAGGSLPNHAGREEIEAAKRGRGTRTTIRESETLHTTTLYHARRVGDNIVRVAIPYQSAVEAKKIIQRGFLLATLSGGYVIVLVFLLVRFHKRRIRRLAADRKMQRQRITRLAEQEAFRRDFLSNVTHEIKTPVTAILGAVELLEEDELPDGQRDKLHHILKGQAGRLNALSEDILALARLEQDTDAPRHDWEPHDLAAIVRTAIEYARPSAERASIELRAETEPVIRPCDDHAVEEALSNLLENAIRYSGAGVVRLRLRKRDDGKGEISVSDDGIGIAPENQPRLFERFYRVDKDRSREKGGTGLGLAIVKHVARLHGGDVTLVSRPGEGCTFTMVL